MTTDADFPLLARTPVHSPGARLVRNADGSSELIDEVERRRYRVDDTAIALWELCDGETTVAEIVSAVCDLFVADHEVMLRDVTRTLTELNRGGLLTWTRAVDAKT